VKTAFGDGGIEGLTRLLTVENEKRRLVTVGLSRLLTVENEKRRLVTVN
jgi:hypothetical protein